jgi:membrane associated rhomboid family serine protease
MDKLFPWLVAYLAHIGGFAAGLVLTFLFRGNTAPRLTSQI